MLRLSSCSCSCSHSLYAVQPRPFTRGCAGDKVVFVAVLCECFSAVVTRSLLVSS